MGSTTTLYVLTISYREGFTINGAVNNILGNDNFARDTTLERYFPYKPTLSEIKEAIPDLDGDVN